MIVEHFKREFVNLVVGKRLIILANQDVDSVCSIRILTGLFKTEGITYVLLSIGGITELRARYEEFKDQADNYLMVNCGGTIDLMDTLGQPPLPKIFFIMDRRRPYHILNYYNTSGQIRLISHLESDEVVPEFDKVFSKDDDVVHTDDDDSDDGSYDDNRMTKTERRQRREADFERERNGWKENREKLLFEYREHSYYARPSALYALEIAWVMSRDDMDSIWSTIIALTDSLVMGRLARSKYIEFAGTLNDHILRINNSEHLPRDCLKIRFERELFLFLYRHWTLYDSAKSTPYLASTLQTYTLDGSRKFHQMLAQLGLPLVEVRQNYSNMNLDLRRQLVEMFSSETVTEKYRLNDIVFGSFTAEIGFRAKFAALDILLASVATLEDPDVNKSNETKFLEAMDVLNVRDFNAHMVGIEKAKSMVKMLNSQVQMMVDMRVVQEIGPFVVCQLSDSLLDFNFFKRPSNLPLLVNFLQHAGVRSFKKKWKQYPWIIMIPHSPEYFLAIGVQPAAYEQSDKNVFDEVFRVVRPRMNGDAILDYFEGSAMLVKNSRRQDFTDVLIYVAE